MAQPGPSGLSQRRRGGGGGTSHLDIDDPSSSRPSSPSLASPALKHRNTNPHNGASGSGGSGDSAPTGAGGHRIAYDPRDLPNTAEEARLPRLTLMEEVLLLGLKDRQGYLSFWNDSISYSLRGAILAELLLRKRLRVVRDAGRGRLDVQDRLVEVVEDTGAGGGKKVKMTGEVLLDEALKMIRGSEEKRSVAEWIDLLSGEYDRFRPPLPYPFLPTTTQLRSMLTTITSSHPHLVPLTHRRNLESLQNRLPTQTSP